MTATKSASAFHKDATKVVAKALKKANGSIKLKKLTKKLLKKINSADESSISEWITANYAIKDKLVTLAPADEDDTMPVDPSNIAEWRKQHKIVLKATLDDEDGQKRSVKVNADTEFDPYCSFDDCKDQMLAPLLNQCTEVNGFATPSPIQAQCWPVLMKGGDVVGIAETGSGKTLAFAMPAMVQMSRQVLTTKKKKPRMLVVAPTRELAMQSHAVLEEFGAVIGLKSLTIYGGVPKYTQVSALKQGNVDMIVATPGRLKDLIDEGSIDLSHVSHLVLDEADRMLDEGFRDEIMEIISYCKSHEDGRQTAMFSATWPAAIQKLALEFMRSPLRVYVGFEAIVGSSGEGMMDDSLSANKRVTQIVEVIEDRARDPKLRQLLQKYHKKRDNRILIFALYKKEAERLEYQLQRDGWKCGSIHGNKNQEGRTKALAAFKDGSCPLLIATDVAARGLDIPNVEYVINFTFPLTIEDYVHRIGRTGRAGKTGVAHTFFQPTADKSHAGELQQVMRQANQDVPEELLAFGSTIKKKEHKLYGAFGPKGGPMKKATKIVF